MGAGAPGASYYAAHYADYERQNSPRKLQFYLGLLARYLVPGATLFELGTGQGMFLQRATETYRCTGCDPNEFGVERTRERAPAATVLEGSVETLRRGPAPYGAVVAWDVLEHLPHLDDGLREVHAALLPGGHLIAVVPVYDGPLGWLVRLMDGDPTHVTKESRWFWVDALERTGFQVVERGGIIRKLLGPWYLHLTAPQWLLRAIGSACYLVARKA